MSSSSEPISPERFALAIIDLPLTNVYTKAAEIRNAMSHLLNSNEQLRPDAERGDQDCAEAIAENRQVIARMEERLRLLKHEVERRGYVWHAVEEPSLSSSAVVDGTNHTPANLRHVSDGGRARVVNGTQGTSNNNAAMTNTVQESSSEQSAMLVTPHTTLRDDDEEGMHL